MRVATEFRPLNAKEHVLLVDYTVVSVADDIMMYPVLFLAVLKQKIALVLVGARNE